MLQGESLVSPEELIGRIRAIIGYFNLDPNRVLDVITDAFECDLEHAEFFVDLLKLYTPESVTLKDLLAFKVKFHASDIPESFFRQMAVFVRNSVVDLDSVCSMLSPDDRLMRTAAEKEHSGAKEFLRKSTIVSTSGKSDEGESTTSELMLKRAENAEKSGARNQKLGLLKALLDEGAWNHAQRMLDRIPCYQAVAVPSIAGALQRLIRRRIDESGSLSGVVVPMLLTLGPYAHDDGVLLYKVLKMLKMSLVKEDTNKIDETSALYDDALTLMDEVFLPSLSMSESNCCLAEEIWSLLRYFPYDRRYRLYGEWKTETFSAHPVLLKKKATLQKQAKRMMQRISKENVKQTSRQLGKLTHSAPTLLFDYVLSQIQLYDNLIGPVVDSFKYVSPLSLDVLAYSIIEALNNPEKDRTKHDGTSISLWLQSLSNFCGAVFKKYPIELTGILQYVANQLKSKRSLDLLILKEVVLKMGGIEAAEEMTLEQVRVCVCVAYYAQ